MSTPIDIVPYDSNWPKQFERAEALIRLALGDNCIAVHHVGSTSIEGLSAKPKIDIIVVVKQMTGVIDKLASISLQFKGEFNIPMRYGFTKRGEEKWNVHLYIQGNPEIELNLVFRDYLRGNPEDKRAYAQLKEQILKDELSSEACSTGFGLRNYTLSKGGFIRSILKKAGFKTLRILKCSDASEWKAAAYYRDTYFTHKGSDEIDLTCDHIVLYLGVDIIGYAQILRPNVFQAQILGLAVDFPYQNTAYSTQFLMLCEQWLASHGVTQVLADSNSDQIGFYLQHHYTKISCEQTYQMEKRLS